MDKTPSSFVAMQAESTDFIPISRILLSDTIVKELKNRDIDLTKFLKDGPDPTIVGGLSRIKIQNVITEIKNNVAIYPIEVKSYRPYIPRHKRTEENMKAKYRVIQGRHRVLASILFGFTHIPAIIST